MHDRIITLLHIAEALLGIAIAAESSGAAPFAQQHCGHAACAVQQHVVHAQPVVHHQVVEKVVEQVVQHHVVPTIQNVYYQVGQPVVQQALMQKAMEEALRSYRFEADVQAQVQATVRGAVQGLASGTIAAAGGGGYTDAPPPENAPDDAGLGGDLPAQAIQAQRSGGGQVPASCVACHAGGKQKGGLSLDGPLSDGQRLAAARRVLDQSMPPGRKLSPEEQAQAVATLLGE